MTALAVFARARCLAAVIALSTYAYPGPAATQDLPIPEDEVMLVRITAEPAGAAMHCDLEWKPYYLSFMQWQRRRNLWDDDQIAFVGAYFGAVQARYSQSRIDGYCTENRVAEIITLKAERTRLMERR